MDSNPSESDFQSALMTEMGVEAPAVEPPAPAPAAVEEPEIPPAADPQVPPVVEPETPPADEPAEGQGEDPKVETPEEIANREEAAQPKPLSKEDIAELLNERESAVTNHTDQIKKASEQVIEALYPQGIDKNVYDSDGKIINTAQDIVDRGLINERTGEAYTYEEAASFMLEAGRKMTENIAELNSYAEGIAEKNVSLLEGNKRVMSKWSEMLGADGKPGTLPKEDVAMLAETYIKTQLKFDKTNSYITEMAMSPEQYYDIALAPYARFNEQQARTAENEVAAEAARIEAERVAAEAEQAERNGIPGQRGTTDVASNTGDPMLDAFIDELKKP